MKVNFWQILGAVLLIIGVIFVVRREMGSSDTVTPAPTVPAATAPASEPATLPAE